MQFGGNYIEVLLEEMNIKSLLSRKATEKLKMLDTDLQEDIELTGVSLGIFDQNNAFRMYLYKLVNGTHRNFERLIIIFIAISSV